MESALRNAIVVVDYRTEMLMKEYVVVRKVTEVVSVSRGLQKTGASHGWGREGSSECGIRVVIEESSVAGSLW